MRTMLTLILVSLALNGFAQTESQGLNIIAPIPPEKIAEYDMKVVIYNEATRTHNEDIGKLTDTGWYIHSILPFGQRIGAGSSAVSKEDLLIVYIRPRTADPKKGASKK
jgi:hypothetical protein